MRRLTEHHVNKTLGAYMVCSGTCIKEDFDCTLCENLNKIVNTLAAYEDTGLEPEEITTDPYGCVFYCNRKCNLDGDFCAEGPGCPHEINAETAKHLLELAQAEKDGRLWLLAVLPQGRPGGQGNGVYVIDDGEIYDDSVVGVNIGMASTGCLCCLYETYDGHDFYDADIGKTVFLTIEEAEAALKKREATNETD